MNDVVVGIDCGTSYIKGTVQRIDGTVLRSGRTRSPSIQADSARSFFSPSDWWRGVASLLRDLLAEPGDASVASVCISAISPVLVAFDLSRPALGVALPYWYLPSIDEGRASKVRVRNRVDFIKRQAATLGLAAPALTDLIGYLNYFLTGHLGLNSLTISEWGLASRADVDEVLRFDGTPAPAVGAPARACGTVAAKASNETCLPQGIPVCYGCPDSFASAIGAGIRSRTQMIYLGTFGTLFQISDTVHRLIYEPMQKSQPYECLVSVPSFGPAIEATANALFPEIPVPQDRLSALDQAATAAEPGADGFVHLLPVWDSLGVERGRHQLSGPSPSAVPTRNQRSRAVLESLGYAIQSLAPLESGSPGVYVGGGGARSLLWLQILADVLGARLLARPGLDDARGASEIAGWALSSIPSGQFSSVEIRAVEPRVGLGDTVLKNVQLAVEMYSEALGRTARRPDS